MRRYLALLALLLIAVPASAGEQLTTAPIKWFDADDADIPEPREIEENQVWDIADHTFFFQVGKLLDLGWTARRLGNLLGVAPKRQADDVNRLDETVGSSWYTNRHFMHPMTLAELAEGPGRAQPDAGGSWEIVAGKFEGGTAGFTIEDAAGVYFLLKFDSKGNDEMGSAAEVIATKILHAAGYNVPRNSVVYFDPALLVIGPKAKVPTADGGKRPMTEGDLQEILDNIIPQPDGRLRCVASRFLEGKPVGVFNYHGRRKEDANDRVDHEHRRELRGLRVIGSWMNDADRRAANTLDMYVEAEDGRRYIRHYIIDMGSTFGSNNLMPHLPKYGNEYVWDPRTILRSLVSLGLYHKGWEEPLPMKYPELGYFENETFDAGNWVPTYPNPAFERCTDRDGYWGAKIVMAFTDQDIAAMVETGHYSNRAASAELVRLLAERRDMIGRYWFARINPLDHFSVEGGALGFTDLAVEGGLEKGEEITYRVQLLDAGRRAIGEAQLLASSDLVPVGVDLIAAGAPQGVRRAVSVEGRPRVARKRFLPLPEELAAGQFHGYEFRTRRGEGEWSRSTRVYFYKWEDGRCQLVRIEREE